MHKFHAHSVPFKAKSHANIGYTNMLYMFRNISILRFTQCLMNVCVLIWRVVILCVHILLFTHPCHITPLAQARPMMLCIYTSNIYIYMYRENLSLVWGSLTFAPNYLAYVVPYECHYVPRSRRAPRRTF